MIDQIALFGQGPQIDGGVTAGEAKALDEAAQMIEEDRLPPEAMPTISPTTAPPASPMAPPTPKP